MSQKTDFVHAVSRESLYEEVWAVPMVEVAVRYSVSSSFLARVCERLRVPRPPRGYWAKQQVGAAPSKPPLPAPEPGDELEWCRGGDPRRQPLPVPEPPRETPSSGHGAAPAKLSKHGLVIGAKELFEMGRTSRVGFLKPTKKLLVDLFVTKESLDRGLRLASRLFVALEHRGHSVAIPRHGSPYSRPDVDHREKATGYQDCSERWVPARPTIVTVGTVAIGLTLYELSESVLCRYVDGEYVRVAQRGSEHVGRAHGTSWTIDRDMPSGRLCLRAYSPYRVATWEKRWPEQRRGSLKQSIEQIVGELEAAAPEIAKLVAEGEKKAEIERKASEERWKKYQEEEARRRKIEAKKQSREQLLSIVDAWVLASNIDSFFTKAADELEGLADDDRAAVSERLAEAQRMFGGVEALGHFGAWKSPQDLDAETRVPPWQPRRKA